MKKTRNQPHSTLAVLVKPESKTLPMNIRSFLFIGLLTDSLLFVVKEAIAYCFSNKTGNETLRYCITCKHTASVAQQLSGCYSMISQRLKAKSNFISNSNLLQQ